MPKENMDKSEKIILPQEIIENILRFVDGHTLLQAELVNEEWHKMVQYVGTVYFHITKNDAYALSSKYGYHEPDKWQIMFRNWKLWQNLETRDHFTFGFRMDQVGVTCAKISGRYIFVGDYSGKLMAISESNEILFYEEVDENRSSIDELHLLNENKRNENDYFHHTNILIKCDKNLYIYELEPFTRHLDLTNIQHISLYKNIMCWSTYCQTVNVVELDLSTGKPDFHCLTNCILPGQTKLQSLCIHDNVVTMITESNVLFFDYTLKTSISDVTFGPQLLIPACKAERYWTFYNEVVFCKKNAYLHFSTIHFFAENINKTFNTAEVLGSAVCDIFLHGHILIVSMYSGMVFFYLIKDWLDFDLAKYNYKITADIHPICSIDVQELEYEHRLVLSSNRHVSQAFITEFIP